MKKLLVIILCAVLLGCTVALLFNRYLHPDMRFFLHAAEVSDQWEQSMRERAHGEPLFIFAGGSETRSSIDPQILLDSYGIRSVNAAMNAGFGIQNNLLSALRYARPGDTIVAHITTDAFIGQTDIGSRSAIYRRGIQAFTTPGIGLPWGELLTLFKCNSSDLNLYAAKRITMPDRIYRYDQQTYIQPSGLMDIRYTQAQATPSPTPGHQAFRLPQVAEPFARFSSAFQQLCQDKGVKLWIWRAPIFAHESYQVQAALEALAMVRLGYQVLRDDEFNVTGDARCFSDLTYHSGPKGVRRNTNRLALHLLHPEFWTEESLTFWLAEHGYNPDGSPRTSSANLGAPASGTLQSETRPGL
ncbi:MAG TPA: hypothetical protein H9976_07395 [Candidatus Akkermansia intestinavium]|nr:hypothetical protein [Candidatus Akkermansia intestinavium]